jgi:hypothetical protein
MNGKEIQTALFVANWKMLDHICYGPAGGPPGGGAGPGGGATLGASGAQAADRLPPSDSYSSLGFSYL